MDELLRHLPEDMKKADEKVDAGDMDSVDGIMAKYKRRLKAARWTGSRQRSRKAWWQGWQQAGGSMGGERGLMRRLWIGEVALRLADCPKITKSNLDLYGGFKNQRGRGPLVFDKKSRGHRFVWEIVWEAVGWLWGGFRQCLRF
jgi:hypothetical protein